MKTDNYLNLCLEQAAKSPLHYRHGCVIVRGGKVIGQGFNDYRPGFNGGALKHGRIGNSALDGPALAELKEKTKQQKGKQKDLQQQPNSSKTFTPFEGHGGGHQANSPLSMHSEMMAIHSALAAASTLSSTAFACEKPCFKLPRGDKRKARLRAEVLKRYVDAICETAAASVSAPSAGTGKVQVQDGFHQGNKRKEDYHNNNSEEQALRQRQQVGRVQHVLKGCRRAFHVPQSGEKHHHHQKRKEKEEGQNRNPQKYQGQYEYEYQQDRFGQQIQQHGRQRRSAASRRNGSHDDDLRGHDSMVHDMMTTMSREACASAQGHGKREKDYKRSGKMRTETNAEPPQPEPMLLPKGQTRPSTTDRKKHLGLMGADLYVARLGWCKPTAKAVRVPTTRQAPASTSPAVVNPRAVAESDGGVTLSSSMTSLPSTSCVAAGSLHDELLNRDPSPPRTPVVAETLDPNVVRASRPCYRCISYMHSVGIKRVFWTTDDGQWEGSKVRDLVSALDNSMESIAGGGDGGPTGNGVFVTKHEVLMLKRLMGENGG